MSYTYKDAISTTFSYLGITEKDVEYIENTNNRGIIYTVNHDKCVIFISPIGCKKDNKQSWVDTRDSGRNERIIAWNYALENNLKYYSLCVNSEQERYKDYFFSIENTENFISSISYRKKESTDGTGTQANIPNSFVPSKAFERFKTEKGFNFAVINKNYIKQYLMFFDNRSYQENIGLINLKSEIVDETSNETALICGLNKIIYGTPGCGKSFTVMKEWNDKIHQRTTFYPDYTNSDFVGQVMPGLDANHQPTYEFIEGPFTKALIDAFNNPSEKVGLIIEELNRGNAAAIFGEIFQLLDRDENGKSRYHIYNPNIVKELNKKVLNSNKPNNKDFENVYIPSNLSIIATMNTSDQNVYPLDNAFQRRWKFERIKNKFLKDGVVENIVNLDNPDNYVSDKAYKLAKMFIPGTSTTWREFVDELNNEIVRNHDTSFSSEDKQIGVYFLSEDELVESQDASNVQEATKLFSEKMLKYIWEDIAKLDPHEWFIDDCMCLDDVFDEFSKQRLQIFKNLNQTNTEEA